MTVGEVHDVMDRLVVLLDWCRERRGKIEFGIDKVTVTVNKVSRTAPNLAEAIDLVRKAVAS